MIKNIKELNYGNKQASLYAKLVNNLAELSLNSETTIQLALGQDTWSTLTVSERIVLGKLVKNNINCGNLVGVSPIETARGKIQNYRIIGQVKNDSIFHAPVVGITDCVTTTLELDDGDTSTALIKATSKPVDDGTLLEVTIYRVSSNTKVLYDSRLLPVSFLASRGLDREDKEINEVLALWYAFDRLVAHADSLKKDFDLSCFYTVIALDLIDKSIMDSAKINANSFEHEDFIRRNFIGFASGNLRRLPENTFLMGVVSPLDIMYI